MPTINQLVRKGRKGRRRRPRRRFLQGRPRRSAVVIEVGVHDPRKPNSGKRHVARVRFDDGTSVLAFIPGEGHNLQVHSTVLVEGGSRPDLPSVNYKIVRGVLDTAPVRDRKQGRSRYGAKK